MFGRMCMMWHSWGLVWLCWLVIVNATSRSAEAVTTTGPGSTANGHAKKNSRVEVLFVAVPVFRHVDPLLEIAMQLAAKRQDLLIHFAVPRWFYSYLVDSDWDRSRLDVLSFILLDGVHGQNLFGGVPPPPWNDKQQAIRPTFLGSSNLTQSETQKLFERSMTDALFSHFDNKKQKRKKNGIDVVISDRYTFAGYNFASAFNIPLIVHNPWTLLDIDNPPPFITCPYSENRVSQDVLSRLWNLWDRLKLRVENMKLEYASYVDMHGAMIPPLSLHGDSCSNRMVLSDSVFGFLDEPRPLPPLQQMVGAILPSQIKPSRLVPNGRRNVAPSSEGSESGVVVLIQGIYSDLEVEHISKALKTSSFHYVGERCLHEELLGKFCGANKRQQATPSTILITNGDVACVQLAAVCGNFIGMILRPNLPEQKEVAIRLKHANVPVQVIEEEMNENTVSGAINTILENKSSDQYTNAMKRFSDALRNAGGTSRAVYWVTNVINLGLQPFTPVECDLVWHEKHLLDVYAFYLCSTLGLLVVLRLSWNTISTTLEAELEREEADNIFLALNKDKKVNNMTFNGQPLLDHDDARLTRVDGGLRLRFKAKKMYSYERVVT